MMVYFRRLLLLLLCAMAACGTEESEQELMVNLQKVQDNPDAQLSNLDAAIALSSRDGSLYARRAIVLLHKGKLNKALKDAEDAVVLTRKEPASLFVKAQVLRAMGRSDQALPLALQAERNSYQNASLYVLLGELYLQRQQYEQAKDYISKAQELSPASEFAFYYKGRLLAATGDTIRAIRNYKLALEQMPQFMEATRELTGVLLARKDFEAAQPYLRNAENLAPQDAQVLFYRGLQYQHMQKQDSAQLYFHKAIATNDTLQEAHYFIGLQLYEQGEADSALTHLLKAENKYKDVPKYLVTLAGVYERTGQPLQALATYRHLIQVAPAYTYGYQAIARIKYRLQPVRKPEYIEELKIKE